MKEGPELCSLLSIRTLERLQGLMFQFEKDLCPPTRKLEDCLSKGVCRKSIADAVNCIMSNAVENRIFLLNYTRLPNLLAGDSEQRAFEGWIRAAALLLEFDISTLCNRFGL